MSTKVRRAASRVRFWLLPNSWFWGPGYLTATAKSFLWRGGLAVVGVSVIVLGVLIMSSATWQDVLAGALLAWGVAMIAWAVTSHRNLSDEIDRDLRRNAELDVLHARLNQIAAKVGAPLLRLDSEFEHAVGHRYQRHAHLSRLEEFHNRAHTDDEGVAFWNNIAAGYDEGS